MISRRTIFSLLLAIMIFLGIRLWIMNHRDPCDAYLPGHVLPATVYVESGTRTVEVPCDWWLPRQPDWLQLTCLLDLAAMVVFGLSVWRDIRRRSDLGRNQRQ
jgi:hypothetical protein